MTEQELLREQRDELAAQLKNMRFQRDELASAIVAIAARTAPAEVILALTIKKIEAYIP